jgi:iron(III) transport system substrate-binding protein
MFDEKKVSRRGFLASGSVLAGAALLGACSSGSSGAGSSPTGSASSGGDALGLSALEQKARQEGGTVTFYTFGSDLVTALGGGFRKAYPWANVQTFVGPAKDVSNKVLAETLAGTPTADVFMLPPTFRQTLMSNGVITPAKLPSDKAMPSNFLDPTGYGHPVYQLVITLLYNTDLVKAPPTDAYDLSSSSWSGKIAFDSPQNLALGTTFLASKRTAWGDQKWQAWLNGLKSDNIFLTSSGGDAYAAVLRGERAICIDSTNDVLTQKKNAPVAAVYDDGDVIQFIQLAWLGKKSKSPYSGQLFLNWVMSQDGQKAMASTGRSPALDIDVPSAVENIVPAGTSFLPQSQLSGFYNNVSDYLGTLSKLWPS